MSNSKINTVITVVAGFLILWLLIDNNSKNKKIAELETKIKDNANINSQIKIKLTELIQNNPEIDSKIANELGQIIALLEIGQESTAVFKLGKIIENLLKDLYKEDSELKELAKSQGRKAPAFADYLEHAKNKKIISSEDYHLLSILKIVRNEEAHELDIKKESSKIAAIIVTAMGFILQACKILNRKTIT